MAVNNGLYSSLIGAVEPFYASKLVVSKDIVKGNKYQFRYRAKNLYGWGPFTTNILEVLAATVPQSPPKPELVSVSATQVVLKFRPTNDNGGSLITDYELWVNTGSPGTTYSKLPEYVFATNSFSFTGTVASIAALTEGNLYSFKYLAKNAVGNSEFSDVLTIPVADKPAKPTTGISLVDRSKTSISVEWTAATGTQASVGNIVGYKLYQDDGSCGNF